MTNERFPPRARKSADAGGGSAGACSQKPNSISPFFFLLPLLFFHLPLSPFVASANHLSPFYMLASTHTNICGRTMCTPARPPTRSTPFCGFSQMARLKKKCHPCCSLHPSPAPSTGVVVARPTGPNNTSSSGFPTCSVKALVAWQK